MTLQIRYKIDNITLCAARYAAHFIVLKAVYITLCGAHLYGYAGIDADNPALVLILRGASFFRRR